MAKLADAIHFDYIEELCDEVLNRLETDEDTWESVVGDFDDIRVFIKEFLTYDDVNFDCLNICNPKCNDYTSEYILDIWTSDGKVVFDCETAKVDDEYDYYKGDVLYMLDSTKQALADNWEYAEKYFVILGEDECGCDDCNCCKGEPYVLNVNLNLDTDETEKIIRKYRNDFYKEIAIFKKLLDF